MIPVRPIHDEVKDGSVWHCGLLSLAEDLCKAEYSIIVLSERVEGMVESFYFCKDAQLYHISFSPLTSDFKLFYIEENIVFSSTNKYFFQHLRTFRVRPHVSAIQITISTFNANEKVKYMMRPGDFMNMYKTYCFSGTMYKDVDRFITFSRDKF